MDKRTLVGALCVIIELSMIHFNNKTRAQADEQYDQLLTRWKAEVIENAQLKKLYDNVMIDFLHICGAYSDQRRRIIAEHEDLDRYGFPQLATEPRM